MTATLHHGLDVQAPDATHDNFMGPVPTSPTAGLPEHTGPADSPGDVEEVTGTVSKGAGDGSGSPEPYRRHKRQRTITGGFATVDHVRGGSPLNARGLTWGVEGVLIDLLPATYAPLRSPDSCLPLAHSEADVMVARVSNVLKQLASTTEQDDGAAPPARLRSTAGGVPVGTGCT
jgi:hypothetical protein